MVPLLMLVIIGWLVGATIYGQTHMSYKQLSHQHRQSWEIHEQSLQPFRYTTVWMCSFSFSSESLFSLRCFTFAENVR